jgi:hypothetical protein
VTDSDFHEDLVALLNDGYTLQFSYSIDTYDPFEVHVLVKDGRVYDWTNDGLGPLDLFGNIPSQQDLQYVTDWQPVQEKYRDLIRSLD